MTTRIGIDIGGTKTHAVAMATDGTITSEVTEATAHGPVALLEGIRRAVGELARATGTGVENFASIGIGIPGQVDVASGTVRQAINLRLTEWHLADAVHDAIGIRPDVDNDVNAAALGARALMGVEGSMAFLNLGTGVAAGIHLNGSLVRGAGGAAGEIGHVSIDPAGPLCDCGQRGCIEAFAGGAALARSAPPGSPHPVRDIFDAADAGRPDAIAVRDGFARGVAGAVRVLMLTVDVDRIIIGGGITALGERAEQAVRRALDASVEPSAFLRSLRLDDRISFLPAALRAPAIGAALLYEAG
ncbi:MAG: ROK family protein [Pseudolysinimonas sp.]